MSAEAVSGAEAPGERTLFSAGVVAAALVAGALSFLAFLWLTAYAPDLSSGRNGGAHALSNGATGFRALGDLLDDVGGRAVRARNARDHPTGGLLVLTPTDATDPALLARIVNARRYGRTLIILPKWRTSRSETARAGWVEGGGVAGSFGAARLLGKLATVDVDTDDPGVRGTATSDLIDPFPLPTQAQTIAGRGLRPLVVTPNGRALVAEVAGARRLYVAADPDIFNTKGLKDLATARAAVALFDHMTPGADRVATFDLTLNGFGGSANLLKLAFEPPFLPATLCLLVAAALAALNAFHPLGPAIREARAIGFGKGALVDSGAGLLTAAGRERLVAARYVELTREAAAARLGVAGTPGEVAARLNMAGGIGRFGALAFAARNARGPALAPALAALHRWGKEIA